MVEGSAAELDRVYAALAHPVRRDLLDRLASTPTRVTQLAKSYTISLAAVSKHIRLLEEAELVRRTIHGRDHVLSVTPNGLDAALDWIATSRSFWQGRLDALDSLLREPAGR